MCNFLLQMTQQDYGGVSACRGRWRVGVREVAYQCRLCKRDNVGTKTLLYFGAWLPRAKTRHEEEDGDSGPSRLSEKERRLRWKKSADGVKEKQGQTSPDSESDPPRRSVNPGPYK